VGTLTFAKQDGLPASMFIVAVAKPLHSAAVVQCDVTRSLWGCDLCTAPVFLKHLLTFNSEPTLRRESTSTCKFCGWDFRQTLSFHAMPVSTQSLGPCIFACSLQCQREVQWRAELILYLNTFLWETTLEAVSRHASYVQRRGGCQDHGIVHRC